MKMKYYLIQLKQNEDAFINEKIKDLEEEIEPE